MYEFMNVKIYKCENAGNVLWEVEKTITLQKPEISYIYTSKLR